MLPGGGRPGAPRRRCKHALALLLGSVLLVAAFAPAVVDSPARFGADLADAAPAPASYADPVGRRRVVVPLPTPGGTPVAEALRSVRGGGVPIGLHLIKVMDNSAGGVLSESEWTLSATGARTDGPTHLSGITPVDSGLNFKPDVYTLGESYSGSDPEMARDYEASAWTCVDTGTGSEIEVSPDNQVMVVAGDDVTCVITNTYIPFVISTPVPEELTPTPCTVNITGHKRYMAMEGPVKGTLVGLSGWRVTASLIGEGSLTAVTTTDALGAYEFTREALGDMAFGGAAIEVCEESRPGWTPLSPACHVVNLPNPLPVEYCVPIVDFTNAQTFMLPGH